MYCILVGVMVGGISMVHRGGFIVDVTFAVLLCCVVL